MDNNGTIAMRGEVPSKQNRAAAESIATQAAGPGRRSPELCRLWFCLFTGPQ